ncbi:hypothetical protein Pmar_PMAR024168 [Perkinsus marinus ATCC 50983]|uniref:Uncharacterized protein n=1 Tax=Perkinsus marinus (strain ATCC 50983 / TXsc) TaxID=423536 RepID=C5L2D2_PERM5|nr:hypothetical protein Pmar_PMAR024168 [Perkinsus marinus ATCC 50983]EER09144.1 hypothetical protein Pmar_PMAR024168 [Perkinsus marinus ATCC 50983]|eukprot:XP_002777328.1 hypothetical protein Pmar_PMAR024168 [Perkinsus marinus ATCC 50983]
MPSAYGLFLFAILTQTATQGKPDLPYQVTADYPPRCYEGPGPGDGSNITDLQAPCCIYNMKGYTFDGVHRETAGIILGTNRPNSSSIMQMNVTLMLNLSLPYPVLLGVEIKTSGVAYMSVGDETRTIYLTIGQINMNHSYGTGMPVNVPIIEAGWFPNKVKTWASSSIKGPAEDYGLRISALYSPWTNAVGAKLVSSVQIYMMKSRNGWDYKFEYLLKDSAHKLRDYHKYAILGNLQDNFIV